MNSSFNTASSPNLNASYNSLSQLASPPAGTTGIRNLILGRKASLNQLTSNSLATIPDASKGYGLSTVLDEDSPDRNKMPPFTPSRGYEIEVGDLVDVPGNMYGTVKFIGSVDGKKGVFAGVELSTEFATRGKNSGDVDG